jgi:hypothetical protein
MIGLISFGLSTFFIILFPITLAVAFWAWLAAQRREKDFQTQRKSLRVLVSGRNLIFYTFFVVILESNLIPQNILEWEDHSFLKNLRPGEIANIRLGSKEWNEPNDIQAIVESLNQAEWYGSRGNNDGPFEPMTITWRSGEVRQFRVGRYYAYDGAILEFPPKHLFLWFPRRPISLYIAGLTKVLDDRQYTLPGEPNRRKPLSREQFLLLAVGVVGLISSVLAITIGWRSLHPKEEKNRRKLSKAEGERLKTQVEADLRASIEHARPLLNPYTREQVLQEAAEIFPHEGIASIMAILDLYGTEDYHRERERVHMAVLRLSRGDLRRLREYVDVARIDYRDVLWWAEYPEDVAQAAKRAKGQVADWQRGGFKNGLQEGDVNHGQLQQEG